MSGLASGGAGRDGSMIGSKASLVRRCVGRFHRIRELQLEPQWAVDYSGLVRDYLSTQSS